MARDCQVQAIVRKVYPPKSFKLKLIAAINEIGKKESENEGRGLIESQ